MPKEHSADPGGYEAKAVKPDAPPRPSVEPAGAEGKATGAKTQTDPNTGEPTEGRPETHGAS